MAPIRAEKKDLPAAELPAQGQFLPDGPAFLGTGEEALGPEPEDLRLRGSEHRTQGGIDRQDRATTSPQDPIPAAIEEFPAQGARVDSVR